METKNQPNIPVSPEPEHHHHKILYTVIGVLLLLLVLGAAALWQTQKETPTVTQQQQQANPTSDWKTYTSAESGFEFKYPPTLTLSMDGNKVVLSHIIPYENNGDCDMTGEGEIYEDLVDFKMSLELSSSKLVPDYVDGEYTSGNLKGNWAYQGAEGCGVSEYYFPAGEGTLLVTRDSIQALSGISSMWKKNEILKVSGVISPEENTILFNQILSTFKFTEADANADWETYTNTELGFEIKLPPRWSNVKIVKEKNVTNSGTILSLQLPQKDSGEYVSVCIFLVYSNEDWADVQNEDGTGKPIFIDEKNNNTYGWACGHDDYGYAGFENYNQAIDNEQLSSINNEEILGPFQEFKKLILPTFKFTK